MLASGDISMVEAQEIMQELSDEHQYIEENQDIIGAGFDIKQLDSGGSNINVTGFKESLETGYSGRITPGTSYNGQSGRNHVCSRNMCLRQIG